MNPGDIVKSVDVRDAEESLFVVLEVGVETYTGPAAKLSPIYAAPIYRLEANLRPVERGMA